MPNNSTGKTQKKLLAQNEELRMRLDEAEEVLRAIRTGEVDALIISSAAGEQVFTLKQVKEALAESEEKFRVLVEHLPSVVYTNAVGSPGTTLYISAQIEHLLGYTPKEWVDTPGLWEKSLHPEDYVYVLKQAELADRINRPLDLEYRMITRSGSMIWVHDQVSVINEHDGPSKFRQGIMLDITERKQAEEALRQSDQRLRQVWETTSDAMALSDSQGVVLAANPAYLALYGYKAEQVIGISFAGIFPQEQEKWALEQYRIAFTNESILPYFESVVHRADGTTRIVETRLTFISNERQRIAMLSTIQDVTERKQAELEIHQRLSELEVLYQSGLVLSQLANPKAIAQKMIDLLDQKMDWHHTAIRLYNTQSQTLELLVFNQPGLESKEDHDAVEARLKKSVVGLDAGFSGWVMQHGQAVLSKDLKNDPRYFETFPSLQSGLYVPIKITERVIGVISIESEQADAFSESDQRLALTLAAQAAIAIENAQLFESQKRATIELEAAYDATIEGWSHALDLRDKETEGHSQRVTDMAVRLARVIGLSEQELVHVRRGALLHDIGKMGIPDHILLKPGKLTADEWDLMIKHPGFAYLLLSPIVYLKPALDIPYCHHEKWDGTGYPRGLKGEQIPLTARIFAVVDVWDALRSDRPYRAAWPEEKVREHILALSGKHFDPQVVVAFTKIPRKVYDNMDGIIRKENS